MTVEYVHVAVKCSVGMLQSGNFHAACGSSPSDRRKLLKDVTLSRIPFSAHRNNIAQLKGMQSSIVVIRSRMSTRRYSTLSIILPSDIADGLLARSDDT